MHRVLYLSSTKFWERDWIFTSGRADPSLVGPRLCVRKCAGRVQDIEYRAHQGPVQIKGQSYQNL
jgi:hypothetical protein